MPLTGFVRRRVPATPGVLAATGWLLLALGCSRKESAPAKVDDSTSAAARESVTSAAFAATLPHVGGPAGYVGSETCRSCHEDQFESWHRSYHRTMTQIAAADTIRAEFHKVTLTNEGVRFVLSRTNNEFWVRVERLASTAQGEALPLSRPSATLYPQGGERAGKGAGEERFKVREQGPKEQPAAHEPPLTPSLSPSEGERVAEGRVRGRVIDPMNAQQPKEDTQEALDVRVGLVTGSHHMQVFWVPGDAGNMQIGFPFTWLIPEKRWVPRNSTFVRPPDVPHRSEVWNVVCSRCHATGIEPRVDTERRTMETRAGELGIACEACHGPGQHHVLARKAEWNQATTPDARVLRSEIVHPKKIEPVRAAQICGFCHSMKWIDKSERWRQTGFRYRPGDDLEGTTPIIRPSRVETIPGLADYLARSPDLLDDFFWSDGMIRVSGREYNGLLESPCYKGGKFSCLSCHSLHSSDPDDQLARNRTDNRACTQCHGSFREEAQLTAHTRHQAGSSGSLCYNCHMPFTTYGVLKAIRSHQVSSPRVAVQLATGRPNACNLCHLDKPLAWTANQLARWYGHSIPDLSEEQTAVADAVRLALAGDAGQRILAAWHLSWEPALQVSGRSWVPPVLAQLLDDPYAAVRCVAERSVKQIAPTLLPGGYDYTVSPDSRPSVQASVLERWSREMSSARDEVLPAQTLVRLNDTTAMQEGFQRLVRQRDPRPVRLRE